MKKLYLFFTLLLSLLGATTAFAQDEVTIPVNMENGKWVEWNGNGDFPFARTWNSTTTPAISICCTTGGNSTTDIRGNTFAGANNMSAWGDNLNDLMFFSNLSTYAVMVAEGWYIKSVEFDFDVTAWTSARGFYNFPEESGLTITPEPEGLDAVSSANPGDTQHIEWENTDEDIYTFTYSVDRIGSDNGFARTSNFIVKVGKLGEAKTALAELVQTLTNYGEYYFVTGTEPGNYGQAEYDAFRASIDKAYDAEYDDDLQALNDEELAAAYRQLKQNILDAYEAVLASRNTVYTVADGYYRIKTGLQYTNEVVIGQDEDGNDITETQEVDKYMKSVLSNTTISAQWDTPADVATDCASLWKITNKDGYLEFQNMATDAYFNDDNPVTMSLTSENLLAIDPRVTLEGVSYVNIRVNTHDAGTGYYLHQGGHASGKGVSGNVVRWSTESSYDGETFTLSGSEWVIVPVDEADAEAIIAAYEPTKNDVMRAERYKLIVADIPGKLEIAHDYKTEAISEEALIHDAEQFTSPASDREEGKDFGALLDDNVETFWHGDWHNEFTGPVQFLRVEIVDDDVTAAALKFTRRNTTANQITQWTVYGSNDPEAAPAASKQLAVLNTPYTAAAEVIQTDAFVTKGFKYLLFAFTGNTNTSAKYAHFAEFQLYKATVTESATSQYNVLGDVATNLESVFDSQLGVDADKVTAEQYETLKAAYDTFIEKFVDPTELRETLAEVSGVGEGIVVGTQPGSWKDANAGDALKALIVAAEAYDTAGAYTQEQSDKYVSDLQAQAEAVYAAAIQIQEGKWYRIRFASEEDFEAHDWNKNAGYVEPAEGEPEVDEPLFGKYLSVANYVEVDEETGIYDLEMFDDDVPSFIGENIHFLADENITKKDMSLFRFIAVGDSAYLLQNKATGLFLKAAGTSGAVTLNVQPSVFNTKAVGYGLSVIASRNLIGGTNENYLHGQKQYNVLVTWNASTAGSASAMYIEEAEDVEADFTNTANIGIRYGAVNAFCYPFEVTEIADGQAWGVASVEGNKIQLCQINGAITAGRPFIYINGETEDFEEEAEAEPVAFTFNTAAIAVEPQNGDALKGSYSTQKLDRGDVYCKDNALVVNTVGKDDIMVSYTYVAANSAYIAGETPLDPNAELEVIWDENAADGIQTALQNVTRTGVIYTLDGRIASKGNLNNVKNLGRGIYILNGTKVVVK